MRSFNTEPTDTDTDGHTLNSFSEGVFAVFGLSGYRAVGGRGLPSSEWLLLALLLYLEAPYSSLKFASREWTGKRVAMCICVYSYCCMVVFSAFCSSFCLSIIFKCAIKIGTARGSATTTRNTRKQQQQKR